MLARQNAGAGTRTRWPVPKLFQTRMLLGVVDMAAERWTKVSVVPGRVGHQVVAPVIERAAVRIGEAVGDVALEFARARFEAVNRGIGVAHRRAPRRLHLRAMKYTVAQINRATGVQHERVSRVM